MIGNALGSGGRPGTTWPRGPTSPTSASYCTYSHSRLYFISLRLLLCCYTATEERFVHWLGIHMYVSCKQIDSQPHCHSIILRCRRSLSRTFCDQTSKKQVTVYEWQLTIVYSNSVVCCILLSKKGAGSKEHAEQPEQGSLIHSLVWAAKSPMLGADSIRRCSRSPVA